MNSWILFLLFALGAMLQARGQVPATDLHKADPPGPTPHAASDPVMIETTAIRIYPPSDTSSMAPDAVVRIAQPAPVSPAPQPWAGTSRKKVNVEVTASPITTGTPPPSVERMAVPASPPATAPEAPAQNKVVIQVEAIPLSPAHGTLPQSR